MALYWIAPSGPAGQEVALLSPTQEQIRQRAAALDPADIVYPAPGGGLLRVPVGGGSPVPIRGTGNGQLWYFDQTAGLWVPSSSPADNQVARWNASLNRYDFVEYTSAGALQYFALEAGTTALLYNFNNTVADQSGNGINFTTGSFGFSYVYPGKVGVLLGAGSALQSDVQVGGPAAITGDMSVELIFQPTDDPGSLTQLLQFAGNGETQPVNQLWGLGFASMSSASFSRRMVWSSEHGAGIDDTYTSGGSTQIGWIHNVQCVGATRIGNVIQPYYMGLPMGPPSAALTTPDGGTSCRVCIGSAGGASCLPGVYFSARVSNRGKSAAEMKQGYNDTMGPAFGRLA